MQEILNWGIEFIKSVQAVVPNWMMNFTKVFTHLGGQVFYLALIPIFFWCFDEKKGFRIAWTVLFSGSINEILKNALKIPRPYILDSSVGGHATEPSYSTPSGHSQGAAVFWGSAFTAFGKKMKIFFRVLCIVLPTFLIGFSRIVLGVHYPTDVLFGWFLGFAIVFVVVVLWDNIAIKFNKIHRAIKIPIVFAISYILNMLNMTDVSMSAALFGLSTGYILLKEFGGFDAKEGSLAQKILRAILGLPIVIVFYFGLKIIFPNKESELYQLFRLIRYVIIGFLGSFVIPKLFIALKIAKSIEEKNV